MMIFVIQLSLVSFAIITEANIENTLNPELCTYKLSEAHEFVDNSFVVNSTGIYLLKCPPTFQIKWSIFDATCSKSMNNLITCSSNTRTVPWSHIFDKSISCRFITKSLRFINNGVSCNTAASSTLYRYSDVIVPYQESDNQLSISATDTSYTVTLFNIPCEGVSTHYWLTAEFGNQNITSRDETCNCCINDECKPTLTVVGLQPNTSYQLYLTATSNCFDTIREVTFQLEGVPKTQPYATKAIMLSNVTTDSFTVTWQWSTEDCSNDFRLRLLVHTVIGLFIEDNYTEYLSYNRCITTTNFSITIDWFRYTQFRLDAFMYQHHKYESDDIMLHKSFLSRTIATDAKAVQWDGNGRIYCNCGCCETITVTFRYDCTGPITLQSIANDSTGTVAYSSAQRFNTCAWSGTVYLVLRNITQCNEYWIDIVATVDGFTTKIISTVEFTSPLVTDLLPQTVHVINVTSTSAVVTWQLEESQLCHLYNITFCLYYDNKCSVERITFSSSNQTGNLPRSNLHPYRTYTITLVAIPNVPFGKRQYWEYDTAISTKIGKAQTLLINSLQLDLSDYHEITLKWYFGFDDCYGPTDFVFTYIQDDQNKSYTVTELSCPTYEMSVKATISNLQNDTEYTFSMTPYTDAGSDATAQVIAVRTKAYSSATNLHKSILTSIVGLLLLH